MVAQVEFSKKLATEARDELLKVFSYIPDDKLNWQVVPTAKSAIRIAAHAALYPAVFAGMIRARQLPKVDNLEEWLAKRNAAEEAITTREQMEAALCAGTDEFCALLDTLTEEDAAMSLDSGQGWSMPMSTLMNLAGLHTMNHSAQIDFLQTCWDDQEIYIWKKGEKPD